MALPGYIASLALIDPELVQVQPAGVDLRVAEIHVLDEEGFLGIESRRIPRGVAVEARDGVWRLKPGFYRIVFMDAVRVPEDAVGFCFPRSSLLRMGATVSCAVWDPGYVGRGEALLVVGNPHGVSIEVGARIAQLVFIKLVAGSKPYRGAYLGERLGGRA